MEKKENQRIMLTRRLLQEGLLRLLATEKLEHISVTALCKEGGINRATFYNHYTSPNALLEEMEQQLVKELEEISHPVKSIEEITDQFEQTCIKLRENADLVNILVRYHADRDLEEVVVDLAQYYSKNRLDMSHTQMDGDTIHLVSTFLYSGCYHMIQEWLAHGINKTPREIATLALSIVSKEYL